MKTDSEEHNIWKAIRDLTGTHAKFSNVLPNSYKDENGQDISFKNPKELADAWAEFAKKKFAATDLEKNRDDLPELEAHSPIIPTYEELLACLKKMKRSKACGPDGCPVEIYLASPLCQQALFDLVREICEDEKTPDDFVTSHFCPIYKNKGSKNDMSKYRYICLLNHSYKLLSVFLLQRLIDEIEDKLPSNQFGFRRKRGTRDAIFLLSTFIDEQLEAGNDAFIAFIDFTAAFDSVSHKFLDESLAKMGASVQSRALFRTIYDNAKGQIRVRNKDGSTTFSQSFVIKRGVVQGDIFSPYGFIIALAVLIAEYDQLDVTTDGQLHCLDKVHCYINSILYADDSAMISCDLNSLSDRLTKFERECANKADMIISRPKTEGMRNHKTIKIPPTTDDEYKTFAS